MHTKCLFEPELVATAHKGGLVRFGQRAVWVAVAKEIGVDLQRFLLVAEEEVATEGGLGTPLRT